MARQPVDQIVHEAFGHGAGVGVVGQLCPVVILDGVVAMSIRDNGKGFPLEREARAKRAKRLGLLGMKERVDMVGGNFNVTSTCGKGTTVLAQIPLMDNHRVGGGRR